MAISIVAVMGMAMLAIDLGMLLKVRAEAQRAADAAALAGASAFMINKPRAVEESAAVARAKQLADTNYMAGAKIDTSSEVTVTVLWDSSKVRVKVRRAVVSTWFGQVFGWKSFPVGAKAAAVAAYATGTRCVKPLAVADMWNDVNGDTNGNHVPDPGETWLYSNPPDLYNPANYGGVDGAGTGYGSTFRDPTTGLTRDWGYQIVLRPSINGQGQPCPGNLQGNKCYMPGWWGLWGVANPPQTQDLVNMMLNCDTTTTSINVGYSTASGWKGPVAAAEDSLNNIDPGARWDPARTDSMTGNLGTVVGSSYGNNWRSSPRVWIMAVFAPDSIPSKANAIIPFNNFLTFYFEGCMNQDGTGGLNAKCGTQSLTVGRFLGLAPGTQTGPNPGTMIRILRLVE